MLLARNAQLEGETMSLEKAKDHLAKFGKADAVISDLGFQVNTGNANSTDYDETVVVYNDDDRKQDAQDIVDELGVGVVEKNNSKYLFDGDLLVVLGTDYDK